MRQFLLGKAPLGQGEAGAIVHQADFAAPPYYLIRDDFTNDVAAGNVPGTDAVPGPGRRDGYDTGSKLAIAGTVMAIVNSVGSQDPTLIYNAVARQAGRILLATITTISTGNHGRIGWSVNDADGTVLDSGLRFVNASSLATQVAGGAGPEVGSFAANTFYEVAIILRAAGFAAYVRGGIYANFELVWLSESVVTSPMFPGAQVIGAGRGFSSHYMHVPAQLWLSAPQLSDGFSSLGESDGLGHAEGVASSIAGQGGDGVTYTQHGTWAVAANALGATALSGGYAIYHAAQSSADVMATVKISTFAGGNAGLLLRYTDSNNHITCHHNGTNLILAKRVAGVGTTIFSPAVTFVAGAELRVNMRGDKFRVFYNGALVNTEQSISDAVLQSATNAGIYTTDTGNRFKDLTIYARGTDGAYDSVLGALAPSLVDIWSPSELSPLMWLDATDGDTLFQDTAGATPITAAGQNVLRWDDKSGNEHHAINSTGSNYFVSRNGYLEASTTAKRLFFDATLNDHSVFVVLTNNQNNAPATFGNFVGFFKSDITQRNPLFYAYSDTPMLIRYSYRGATGGDQNITYSAPSTAKSIYTMYRTGTAVKGTINGTNEQSMTLSPQPDTDVITTGFMGGIADFYEILVFDHELSTEEKSLVVGYLKVKHGIS